MELAIATVVGYLVKKLKDNKSVQDFFSDFTSATVRWIKLLKESGGGERVLREFLRKEL